MDKDKKLIVAMTSVHDETEYYKQRDGAAWVVKDIDKATRFDTEGEAQAAIDDLLFFSDYVVEAHMEPAPELKEEFSCQL